MTQSSYTAGEDFSLADAVFECIGDAGDEQFSLHDLTTPGGQPCNVMCRTQPQLQLLSCSVVEDSWAALLCVRGCRNPVGPRAQNIGSVRQ